MNSYRLTFTINGKKTEQIVRASSESEARDLIKMQYSGAHIVFVSTGRERMR